MRKILWLHKKYMLITMILMIVTSITTLITPYLLQVLDNKTTVGVSQLLLLIVISMGISFLIQFILIIYRENFAANFNTHYLSTLLCKTFHLSYDKYVNLESSYIVNRLFQVVDSLYMFITISFASISKSTFVLVVSLILFFQVHWIVFLVAFILIPFNFFSFRYINNKLHTKITIMQQEHATANRDMIITLSNADYVKQIAHYAVLERILLPAVHTMYTSLAAANKFGQGTSSFITFTNQFIQNILYISISYLVINESMPVSSILIISILMPIFFSALNELTKVNIDYRTLKVSQEFIDQELEQNQELTGEIEINEIKEIAIDQPTTRIEERQLAFSLSEVLHKGDIAYLSGPSGAGKSTLLKLILKFRKSSGIQINGINIMEIANHSLRSKIAYLSQNTTILSDTIEKNIGLGQSLTTTQKQYLENTLLLSPIFLTKTWDTILIDNGANLSGGEKQRIALARIWLSSADVWILDESTSNMDEQSSNEIFEYLLTERQERILIFTSHDQKKQIYANKYLNLK